MRSLKHSSASHEGMVEPVPDLEDVDLTFPQMPYGTHQVPWDLRVLLYKGAASASRKHVGHMIQRGEFGRVMADRLPLVERLHEQIAAKLRRGGSPSTIEKTLGRLWAFFKWADSVSADLSLPAIKQTFRNWTEHLLHRVRVTRNLAQDTAYHQAMTIADLVARAIDSAGSRRASGLLALTRLRSTSSKKRVLGTQPDKANLEATFAFGQFLADICEGLSVTAVRGPLPVTVILRDSRSLVIAGGLKNLRLDTSAISAPARRRRRECARAPLAERVSAFSDIRRTRLLTLRVEAELLIFIAQTGMNLAQAYRLERESFRWQTHEEDLVAHRVYKDRRGGEAVFRCFKAYRKHLERYLSWLDHIGWSESSSKLFPFYYPSRIPPEHALPTFTAIRSVAEPLSVQRFGPRSLRNVRVNWLLRRSSDPALTADMAAHTTQTLLRDYARPHHQRAAVEITKFHLATDPSVEAPGPGLCVGSNQPAPIEDMPCDAPPPDCVSPEGCLFCKHHRDVLSQEYCWKLASHAKLKAMEVSLYRPPTTVPVHPGDRVIERITDKLIAIAEGSAVRAQWLRDAQDLIRAGRYHPIWDGHIQLLEAMT